VVRLQLIDTAGKPVAGVVPNLRYVSLGEGGFFGMSPVIVYRK